MQTKQQKFSPVKESATGMGSQQQYFSADEAMEFLEPRIRAMFR